jgi:hypothetical protein
LSGHSLKRGALTILAQLVVGGLLDIELLPRLAKHKSSMEALTASTLRYMGDRVVLARMLRTQEATSLIPCLPRLQPAIITLPPPPPEILDPVRNRLPRRQPAIASSVAQRVHERRQEQRRTPS